MLNIKSKPTSRTTSPFFSSGPCAKRPGWSLSALEGAVVGRSHRSTDGKAKLKRAIDLTRDVLRIPDSYRIAIVPASDTGAVEMALWSLLGARGVDVLAWESFGSGWVTDIVQQLKIPDVRIFEAPYGKLPDFSKIDFDRDVVFPWNGTTSGVRIPNANFIPSNCKGLVICDATSAVFAQSLDFEKLDVITFSWQKVLGGEGGHGILVLSPRAVERLESYKPTWPLPKIFRMTKKGKLIEGLFSGETINTPSMLCVEDYIDALLWCQSIGGLDAFIKRSDENADVLYRFILQNDWIENLAVDLETRSNTSVCMKIVDPDIVCLGVTAQAAFAKSVVSLLEKERVAFDIGSYRDAPPGFRVWTGATVNRDDLLLLCDWFVWAFFTQKNSFLKTFS
ncbi:Phosphoserine aminotransferase [Liberibacter crescens BT-1]|uniref:phosphoserine transaminase n=1 Tax=Liberibacter crescens (strain BT-1) TaxID=1215343 RepID=L0EV55_LIBCB|nr:phosphoserine transaminase [Liberibacter crescens]AGA64847.1 Phosphoserine aminotransferase [Liberibacter crescens BT-1]AMC12897.1 phosphoserine aminotransferase [Liberibacter crescens]